MKIIVYIISIFLIGDVYTKTINKEFFQRNINKRIENNVLNASKLPEVINVTETLDMKNNETKIINQRFSRGPYDGSFRGPNDGSFNAPNSNGVQNGDNNVGSNSNNGNINANKNIEDNRVTNLNKSITNIFKIDEESKQTVLENIGKNAKNENKELKMDDKSCNKRTYWKKQGLNSEFVSGTNKEWIECQDGVINARYVEYNRTDEAIVLFDKDRRIYVKITDKAAYWSEKVNDIDFFLSEGSWLCDD